MYKKLDCECGHPYNDHVGGCALICLECVCMQYDPAGNNPELENILCPQCRLVRMERTDETYWCCACQYIMLERQVKEICG